MAKKSNSRKPKTSERGVRTGKSGIHREKERAARRTNTEKQKRYRESMKAQGYKAKLIWEKPSEAGWIKATAPVIRESSLNVTTTDPAIKEVLDMLSGTFIVESKRRGVPEETWKPVYRDLLTLLKPLGIGE